MSLPFWFIVGAAALWLLDSAPENRKTEPPGRGGGERRRQRARSFSLVPDGADVRRAGQSAREKAKSLRSQASGSIEPNLSIQLETEASKWEMGAEGEERVGRILNALPAEQWAVLHDIDLPSFGNVDHLVVSNYGIFVLDTKVRRRTVWVSEAGIRVDELNTDMDEKLSARACFVEERLRMALGPWARVHGAALVFVDTKLVRRGQPEAVVALSDQELVNWLLLQPYRYTAERTRLLVEAALAPETWD